MTRRFLVIGGGSIGRRHIRNLTTLGAGPIVAFDTRPDRRRELETQFAIETVDDLAEAWTSKPDVALITVPTALHIPMAVLAAEHQCHLFIEKPLADRIDGADHLLGLVERHNLVTLVGCNMRFHPGLARVKALLDQDAIGRVVAARVEMGQYLPDWHPWEDYRQGYSAQRRLGGGVILDAIHEIDYLCWMLGTPRSVVCFSGRLSDLEIDSEDTAAILLRHGNGAIGEIHLDYVQRAPSRTCQMIGTAGTIHWSFGTGEVRWFSAATKTWDVFLNPPEWDPNDMYLDEMRHFLGCLDRQERPAVNVCDAAALLEIALAAKASAESGQVVSLES